MATIRLTILSSIKEHDGRLPILVCISQKKERAYIKTEFLLDDIAEFNNGKVAYRKDAGIMNKRLQFVFSQYKEKFDAIENIEYFSALQIKQMINSKERPSHISFLEFWKKRISEFREEGRESYAKMNEETIRIFTLAEGDIPIPAINTLMIEHFKNDVQDMSVSELMEEVIKETGYIDALIHECESEEATSRIENIDELRNKIAAYEENCETQNEASTLSGFLEDVALVADIDSLDESTDYVVLMTLHSAKGLEFPHVYLAGMEDGLFPSYMTITADDPAELEEERRLCYVGITRAKKKLYLSAAKRRMMQGRTQFNKVSRFIDEIPEQLLQLDTGVNFKEKHPDKALFSSNRSNRFRKPYQAKSFTSTKMDTLPYDVGDMVKHIKFGKGKVLEIVSGGRDYEVTVDFEKAGVKKMFASFAKLKKVE